MKTDEIYYRQRHNASFNGLRVALVPVSGHCGQGRNEISGQDQMMSYLETLHKSYTSSQKDPSQSRSHPYFLRFFLCPSRSYYTHSTLFKLSLFLVRNTTVHISISMCRPNVCSFNSEFLGFVYLMSAPPPVGSIRMAAPFETTGGVQLRVSATLQFHYKFVLTIQQFQKNHRIRPHIVLGHGLGRQDIHVAPVSNTDHPAFLPRMSVEEMAPGLVGNVHLGHVTADESILRPPKAAWLHANIGVNHLHAINQGLSPMQFQSLSPRFDLYISSQTISPVPGPSGGGSPLRERSKGPPQGPQRPRRRSKSPRGARNGLPSSLCRLQQKPRPPTPQHGRHAPRPCCRLYRAFSKPPCSGARWAVAPVPSLRL